MHRKRHHLTRNGVPLGQLIVEFILDIIDMFPEQEHLSCRRKRVRTDDRDRREFRTPQSPSFCHFQQLVNVKLIRMVDVEGNLLQFGTQYDFRRVLVGIQDVDEREVFALREH